MDPNRRPSIFNFFRQNSGLNATAPIKPIQLDEKTTAIVIKAQLECLVNLLEFKNDKVRQLAKSVIECIQEKESTDGRKYWGLNESGWMNLAELATKYDGESILENVAMALTIFAANNATHKEMLQYIGWPLVMRLANVPSVQKIAITLIGYLALNEEVHRPIMDNFLDLLIYVGKSAPDCANAVSTVLANLTLDARNAIIIGNRGGLDLTVTFLNDETQIQLIRGAVNTIANILLAEDEKLSQKIAEKALLPLVKLLKSYDPNIQRAAALSIAQLTLLEEFLPKIIELSACRSLVDLMRKAEDEDTLISIGMALNNLAENELAQKELIQVGVTDLLLDQLSKATNEDLLIELKETLNKIDPIALSKIPNDGSPELPEYESTASYASIQRSNSRPFVPSPQDDNNRGSKVTGNLLGAIEMSEAAKRMLGSEEINSFIALSKLSDQKQKECASHPKYHFIPNLTSLLFINEENLQERVLEVLSFIAHNHDVNQNLIMSESKAITEIISMLEGKLSSKAANAIAAIAYNNKKVAKELSIAVVPTIYLLRHAPKVSTKKNAAFALFSLCTETSNQNLLFKKGGIDVLLSLLHTSYPENLTAAVCAALAASCKANYQVQNFLRKQRGVFSQIVRFLSLHDVEVVTYASSLVRELARDNDKNQQMLIDEGTHTVLVSVLTAPGNSVQYKLLYSCLGAVWVLCKKKNRRKVFYNAGLIEALEVLKMSAHRNVADASRQILSLLK